jgi:anti-sigma B factor antagonist
MKTELEQKGSVSVVRLSGELKGGADEHAWADQVTNLIDTGRVKVVMDMGGVFYVSSAGLGQLVRVIALANSQGAKVVLSNLTPFVAGVLTTTGLNKFFEVHSDVDSAVGKIG